MPVLRRIGVALGLFLLSACRTQLLDDAAHDLGRQDPDAAMRSCASAHRPATPVALTSVTFLDRADQLALGRAVRIGVTYPLRAGCDLPGRVDARVTPGSGNDQVVLTAHAWLADENTMGCGPTTLHTELIVLSELSLGGQGALSSPKLLLVDGASGGTVKAQAQLAPRKGQCGDANAGFCTLDCQCPPSTPARHCSDDHHGNASNGCHANCSTQVDCGRTPKVTCSNEGFCVVGSPCENDSGCGFGQRCQLSPEGNVCVPEQPGRYGTPCACDTDCGFGGICVIGPLGGQCALPCTATSGCPDALACYPWGCAASR